MEILVRPHYPRRKLYVRILLVTQSYPLFAVEDSFFPVYLRLLWLSMYVNAANTTNSNVKISNVFIESPLSVSEKGNRGTIPILSTLIMEYYSIFWLGMSLDIIIFLNMQ